MEKRKKINLDFVKRRSQGKLILDSYFDELSKLFKASVEAINNGLISLEESDVLIETIKNNRIKDSWNSFTIKGIPFKEKKNLQRLINDILTVWGGGIIVNLKHSEYCGLLELPSILDFNVDFNFTDEHQGLIILYSTDLNNALTIDFYEEDNQEKYDVEIEGTIWARIFESIN